MSTALPAPGLAQRFALILGGLCDAAAARMSRPTTVRQQVAFPLMMLLWSRLHRTIARFAVVAGRPATAAAPRSPAQPRTVKPSGRKPLPGGFGWLLKLLPEAAVFGCQLQHFLTDPEMAALIAANPKMASLLRPLCRMLAVPGPPKPTPIATPQAAPTTEATAAPGVPTVRPRPEDRPEPSPAAQTRNPDKLILPDPPPAIPVFGQV